MDDAWSGGLSFDAIGDHSAGESARDGDAAPHDEAEGGIDGPLVRVVDAFGNANLDARRQNGSSSQAVLQISEGVGPRRPVVSADRRIVDVHDRNSRRGFPRDANTFASPSGRNVRAGGLGKDLPSAQALRGARFHPENTRTSTRLDFDGPTPKRARRIIAEFSPR